MSKFLILLSIAFNTLGFSGQAAKIDQSALNSKAGTEINAFASSPDLILPLISPRPEIKANAPKPTIYAKDYVLVDDESGVVLTKQNAHDPVPIASTTKIMTASIVLENYKLDDVVTISSKAANEIGASAGFVTGEKITVLNLLNCLLIKSANGAADAFAEHMNAAGETGMQKFVDKMNAKAKELGMTDTEYHDPAGLDVTGHSSAYDLSVITRYAMKKDTFASIVIKKEATVTDVTGKIYHSLENSNRLVREWSYPGAIGVKTGYMPEAGHCLVGAARRDGHTLVAIILNTNADTPSASAEEARKLLDWGWQNVGW